MVIGKRQDLWEKFAAGDPLQSVGWYNSCPRRNHAESGRDRVGVENAARSSAKEVERLNAALTALGNLGSGTGRSKHVLAAGKRKPMSAAGRKKIAAGQRARWAKWKKNKQNK
jgi:hypothetical protein